MYNVTLILHIIEMNINTDKKTHMYIIDYSHIDRRPVYKANQDKNIAIWYVTTEN